MYKIVIPLPIFLRIFNDCIWLLWIISNCYYSIWTVGCICDYIRLFTEYLPNTITITIQIYLYDPFSKCRHFLHKNFHFFKFNLIPSYSLLFHLRTPVTHIRILRIFYEQIRPNSTKYDILFLIWWVMNTYDPKELIRFNTN